MTHGPLLTSFWLGGVGKGSPVDVFHFSFMASGSSRPRSFGGSVVVSGGLGLRWQRARLKEVAASNSNRHDLLPVTVKPGEATSSPSSPAPNSPLERGGPSGSSAFFTPSSFQGELARRAVGRSPKDRLTDRDEIGLALYSPFRAPRDHWWRV